MTGAGRRNKRIQFERPVARRSAGGTIEERFPELLGKRWAQVTFGGSAERRAAAQESAVQSATFRVLADSLTRTVLVTDRIRFRDLPWDITGIAEIGAGPAEIEFTATAKRG